MVSPTDVYHVFEAVFPLYTALFLAYASLKWWRLFTPEQCAGINKFVASFSVPLLSFQVIAANDIYRMNVNLVFADLLQKALAFAVLIVFAKVKAGGIRLSWVITGLSVTTLPNTLILGIPVLRAMYGAEAAELLSQIVVLQSLVWYNILLLLFEINATTRIVATVTQVTQPSNGEAEVAIEEGEEKDESEDETKSMRRTISSFVLTVGKKLIRNPNTHSTLAGLIWSTVHFKFGVQLPKIVERSISLLSDGGLGMAMFSLGLFMASQSRILACGTRKTILATALKFVVGPIVMAGCSVAVGLRGTPLKVAIIQAALPQGIVPFVFAKEYNVHPDILSTGILLGLLIATPITLAYYYLLSL